MENSAPNRRGRPSRLTPELIRALAAKVKEGHPRTVAAASCKVHDSVLSRWMTKGRKAAPGTPVRTLHDEILAAEAEWEANTVEVITDAAKDHEAGGRALRAAQWLLTHHPSARYRWGKKLAGEEGGKPMEVDVQAAKDRLVSALASIATKVNVVIEGVTDVLPEEGGGDVGADQSG